MQPHGYERPVSRPVQQLQAALPTSSSSPPLLKLRVVLCNLCRCTSISVVYCQPLAWQQLHWHAAGTGLLPVFKNSGSCGNTPCKTWG